MLQTFFCSVSDDVVLSRLQLDPSDDILRILTLPLSPSHEHPLRLKTMHSHLSKGFGLDSHEESSRFS